MSYPAQIFHAPPGELPAVKPGDIGLVHDYIEDTLGELIQGRERGEFGHTAWANITHSFGVMTAAGEITEANRPGVQRAHIEKYRSADLHIIRPLATAAQLTLCVERWDADVGMAYDVVGFLGLAADSLFGLSLVVSDEHGLICSAHVSFGMLAYVVTLPKPYQKMDPADIGHDVFALDLGEPPMPLSFFGRFLDRLRTAARRAARAFRAISPF